MKQIKIIIAAFVLLASAVSCKKENDVVAPPVLNAATVKLVKLTEAGTNYVQQFTYDASGRIIKIADNAFTHKYNYAAGTVAYESFKSDNTKFADFTNIVFANNKMVSFGFRMYNAGQPSDAETNTLQYDANGYQVKKSYENYVYDYSIMNGNTVNTKYTDVNSGQIRNTVMEYYTDKPNKLNINLFENWYLDQYMFDQELFGRKNAHLPKKITTNSGITELSYTMNSGGLPAQVLVKYTPNGGLTTLSTLNLTYQ